MPLPTTMRAVEASGFSLDALHVVERPVPKPRRGEILVRIRAASLNYRDLAVLVQGYMPNLKLPYVPASDASGEVVATGEDVTRFKTGDRVVPIYTQGWHAGMPTLELRTQRTLGGPLPGVLQDYIVVPAEDAVTAPAHLSHEEAATLPIAAVTAWSTLIEGGIKAGDTVLVEGTGGVALFALQFAKLNGATVIALSSSDDKLARARQLGADVGINYRTTPEWNVAVREATQGRGADIVVETAGSTLSKSLASVAFGGFIGVVGFVAGYEATIPLRAMIGPMVRVQGIAVGSRERFETMNRAITLHRLKPVIDGTFPFEQTADAFRRMERGAHFGKIVIAL
jgi:NADPH:quinone reductase-like Zn-dependent oxidoreductase